MAKNEGNFLKNIRADFRKIIFGSILLNILFLIFGIIIFMNVNMTIEVVGVVAGIYFIIFGLYSVFEYFSKELLPIFRYKIF